MPSAFIKALNEAAQRIKAGEPAGLTIHIMARKYGVKRHHLASNLGKRAAAKKASLRNAKQLSLPGM